MEWIESLVLGLVQGVTEFLPVSSDGHLNVTRLAFAKYAGVTHTEAESLFFFVMLHLGTLAAIAVHYRAVIVTGAKGLLGSEDVPPTYRRNAVIRVGILAFVATLPLIPYVFLKDYLEAAFKSSTATAVGFLITASVLIVTVILRGGDRGPRETTWVHALLIGIAQAFAPLPGVSRSGLTVASALGLGLSRSWSVGFSLLIAFPAILGATAKELLDVNPATLTTDRIAQTAVATVVAGLVGYAAIIWLVKIVRAGRLWYFSVYLVLLAIVVLVAGARNGGSADAPVTKSVDRTSRLGPAGPGARGVGERPVGGLDRRLPDGEGAAHPRPRTAARHRPRPARLVLAGALADRP